MASVRLPLAVGVDTAWRVGVGFALLVPGVLLAGNGAILLARGEEGGLRLAIGVAGALGAVALLFLAWRSRASDAVLDAEGIAIEGGPRGGVRLPWQALAKARLDKGKSRDSDHVLTLKTRDGASIVLAQAAHAAEKLSIAALHATLAARLGETPAPAPKRGEVTACNGCGVPLPPSDLPEMHCPSCGQRNPVAAAVRERAAAQRAIDLAESPTSIAVRHLLGQRGARSASAILLATFAVSALGWAPVLAAYALMGLSSLGAFEIGLGLFNGWSFTFAAFAAARVALSRRRSLQVLTTTFAALPAARAGEAPGCRMCGGPLPESRSPVVRCAYCDAENVLGLDVRPLLQQVEGHRGSVADLLRDQKAERGRFVALGVAGAIAAAIGGFWLVVQVAVAAEIAEDRAACARGDFSVCAALGDSYFSGSTVDKDEAAAAAYYGLACNGGHAEACSDLAQMLEHGWGVPEDAAAAGNARARSCALGFAEACAELRGPVQ